MFAPRPIAAALVCLVAAGLSGCGLTITGLSAADLEQDARTMDVIHVAGTPLEVQTTNGAIKVTTAPGADVRVDAVLRGPSRERLDRAEVVHERRSDGTLALSVLWPDGKRERNEGCSFEISIPDADGATLETHNGRVEVSGLAGALRIDTSNGPIVVHGHGGSLVVDSSNGGLDLTDIAGDIEGKTSNGNVKVSGTGAIDVKTSNGSITIDVAPGGGPVKAKSSNGNSTLRLPPDFAGELTLDTSNGKVDVSGLANARVVDSGKSHAKVVIGNGGAVSELRTSNGRIQVTTR